ncbi:Lactadherin [Stylophora pistillata]|uniref:Lactadherin n=1 Tax=Stylophora pistillata TaxID=50429 RepID=A0A2B4RFU2_STYPI|nr:Lactadherin [Stylophora pistillata]
MEIRLVLIQVLMWCILCLKGISVDRPKPILSVELSVDDSQPLFQGNKTKLNVNVTHDINSTSAASHIIIIPQASFKAEFSSINLSSHSVTPDVLQNNRVELNRLEPDQQFSYEVFISIDPHGLTEPGRVHIAYVISTITYSGDYDNFTDPNTGKRVTKTTDNSHTSFYFYVPEFSCFEPLGMRSGYIKESQLLSSSFFKTSQNSLGDSPHHARLGSSGHWSPAAGSASIDREQFIQINFGRFIQLKVIALQGKPNSEEHVKTFNAWTSLDGEEWKKENPLPKGLVNVTNGNAAIPTAYQIPTSIRFLRIQPTSWHKGSALRIEVYGCYRNETAQTEEFPALGVEKQLITNAQMTASSTADLQKLNATSGRLNFNSAWCSANSNEQPLFLQIDLNEIHIITAVATQPRPSNVDNIQSVTKYSLNYSEDGVNWSIYQQNGIDKKFFGNLVEDIPTKTHLPIPVKARLIQFLPLGLISAACMRVELYGEKSTTENTGKPPVYQRSILLDERSKRLFLCNKESVRGKAVCFIRIYLEDESWIALDRRIVSILGYDQNEDVIYGVARNRRSYLRCNVTKCAAVPSEDWLRLRDLPTTVLSTEIPFVPETGRDFTDTQISEYEQIDNDGNKWGDLNKCYSGPCENGGSCVGNKNDYTCFCLSDWAGKNCDTKFVAPQIEVTKSTCSSTTNKVKPLRINTPKYPNNYGSNSRCEWLITSSHRIKLVFKYFYVERGWDYVYIHDGKSTSSRRIGRFTGGHTNKVIKSSGNYLYLKFTSDSVVNKKGFLIVYEAWLVISLHLQEAEQNGKLEPKYLMPSA